MVTFYWFGRGSAYSTVFYRTFSRRKRILFHRLLENATLVVSAKPREQKPAFPPSAYTRNNLCGQTGQSCCHTFTRKRYAVVISPAGHFYSLLLFWAWASENCWLGFTHWLEFAQTTSKIYNNQLTNFFVNLFCQFFCQIFLSNLFLVM